jgi:hypothetical protein
MNATFTRRAALIAPLIATALAFAPALLPGVAMAATQGSGTSATETRSVGDFNGVATHGSIDLLVRQGATSVQVQADDNLLPLLETVVEGGTLHVRWRKGQSINTRSKVLVTIATPQLTTLSGSGSGDIKLEAYRTPALQLRLSGSGDARLDQLTTDELDLRISGSSDVIGAGSAGKVKIAISGSGDVRLADMRAEDVSIRIAGSGDAQVNANKTLDVSIAGSGDVSYSGAAAVKTSVAGSGTVRRR